jgi:multidrug efflux pump subunit AcrA (membrane-fusion protein)
MFFHELKTGTAVLVTFAGILLAGGGLAVHFRADARSEPQRPGAAEPPRGEAAAAQERTGEKRFVLETPPKPVTVRQPLRRKLAPYEDFAGRLEALHAVEVRARASGRLQKVFFKAGTEVKKGDLLFEIDPTVYRVMLDKAEANLALAEAQKKRSDAELQRGRRAAAVVPQEQLEGATDRAAVADGPTKPPGRRSSAPGSTWRRRR